MFLPFLESESSDPLLSLSFPLAIISFHLETLPAGRVRTFSAVGMRHDLGSLSTVLALCFLFLPLYWREDVLNDGGQRPASTRYKTRLHRRLARSNRYFEPALTNRVAHLAAWRGYRAPRTGKGWIGSGVDKAGGR